MGLLVLLLALVDFNLPSESPVTSESMNYTCAAVGLVAGLSLVTWFTTARANFTGPSDVRIIDGVETPGAVTSQKA